MKLKNMMFFLGVGSAALSWASEGVGPARAGYCDAQVARLEGARVFASMEGGRLSCDTVFVAPSRSETKLVKFAPVPRLRAKCERVFSLIESATEPLRNFPDIGSDPDMERLEGISSRLSDRRAFERYKALAVQKGADVTYLHQTDFGASLRRIVQANPKINVRPLPMASVSLDAGSLIQGQGMSAERYLASVPAILGARIEGQYYDAWHSVSVFKLPDFGPERDAVMVTERWSLARVCAELGQEAGLSSLVAVSWKTQLQDVDQEQGSNRSFVVQLGRAVSEVPPM